MPDFPRLVVDILIPGLLTLAMSGLLSVRGLPVVRRVAAVLLLGTTIALEAVIPCPYGRNAVFVLNVVPLCAGLTFGLRIALAGVIVAIPCVVAVNGTHGFTFLSVHAMLTCLFLSALCGGGAKAFLKGKRPGALTAAVIAIVIEAAGGLATFLLARDDGHAYVAINDFLPMQMAANAAAAVIAMRLPSLRTPTGRTDCRSIAKTLQTILGCCSVSVFLASIAALYLIQTNLATDTMRRLLRTNMQDIKVYLQTFSEAGIAFSFNSVVKGLEAGPVTTDGLLRLAGRCSVIKNTVTDFVDAINSNRKAAGDTDATDAMPKARIVSPIAEIDVADASGIVVQSTNPRAVGLDLSKDGPSGTVSLPRLGETTILPTASRNSEPRLKYAIRRLPDGRIVRIGLGKGWLAPYIQDMTTNWHIGETGSAIIIDDDLSIVSDVKRRCTTPKAAGITADIHGLTPGAIFTDTVFDVPSYVLYDRLGEFHLFTAISEEEIMHKRDVAVTLLLTCGIISFAILSGLVYALIKVLVVDNIGKVNGTLSRITAGDLDERVRVRSNDEFVILSENINKTVEALRRHIDEAAKRLDKELEFARSIQYSALPGVFPPYPLRRDFDIHAAMSTAKEVGGDFYDFALRNDDELVFLVADVSGKGIPAALFMMRTKTILRAYAEAGLPPQEIAARANEALCADNETNMFVTAWVGILDTRTGETAFANAGHNPPLVRRGGEWSYLRSDPCLPLAAMDGVPYAGQRFRLGPGDAVVLYTDGVTEAMDGDGRAYGEARPLDLLASTPADGTAEDLCRALRADVAAFVGDAPQSDDITMLALIFNGSLTREDLP